MRCTRRRWPKFLSDGKKTESFEMDVQWIYLLSRADIDGYECTDIDVVGRMYYDCIM